VNTVLLLAERDLEGAVEEWR